MNNPILYCGDTTLMSAAAYLAGCLTHAGWSFDYIPTGEALTSEHLEVQRKLIILSDFPASDVSKELQQKIIQQVEDGMGLLMIGGWESFQGLNGTGGGWAGTPVGDILPVEILHEDDRRNCGYPVFITERTMHPIIDNLPWEKRPPLIGGYNAVTAKPKATTVLQARCLQAQLSGESIELFDMQTNPLLVVDDSQRGRCACLMTDLAPHWVGPLVDWGTERVTAQAPGAEEIEVGSDYLQFVQQLIAWTGKFSFDKL